MLTGLRVSKNFNVLPCFYFINFIFVADRKGADKTNIFQMNEDAQVQEKTNILELLSTLCEGIVSFTGSKYYERSVKDILEEKPKFRDEIVPRRQSSRLQMESAAAPQPQVDESQPPKPPKPSKPPKSALPKKPRKPTQTRLPPPRLTNLEKDFQVLKKQLLHITEENSRQEVERKRLESVLLRERDLAKKNEAAAKAKAIALEAAMKQQLVREEAKTENLKRALAQEQESRKKATRTLGITSANGT